MKSKGVKSQSDKDSVRSRKTILCCCLDFIICGVSGDILKSSFYWQTMVEVEFMRMVAFSPVSR